MQWLLLQPPRGFGCAHPQACGSGSMPGRTARGVVCQALRSSVKLCLGGTTKHHMLLGRGEAPNIVQCVGPALGAGQYVAGGKAYTAAGTQAPLAGMSGGSGGPIPCEKACPTGVKRECMQAAAACSCRQTRAKYMGGFGDGNQAGRDLRSSKVQPSVGVCQPRSCW